MSSRLLSSLKGYASSSRSQGSGGSAGGGGSGGSHRTRLFSAWGGGDGAGEGASEVPHDPGFDDAKRKWGELDEFFTTVYQAYLQATTGIIDVARPLNRLESTVRDYFDDQEAESRVVRRFSSSVVKLNVATMRFEEVLEEGRVQADLEEWILKLEEIKRDIEARERLYSEFVREKKSWNHAHQKAEHKRMTEDPATIAKLNRLESAWQAAHEGFKRTNKKIILSVNELSTQVKPALQEYLQALGVAQYGLYHTLNVAYAAWQEDDDPQSAPSIIPARVKAGSNSTRASMASPQKSLPAVPLPATPTPTSPLTMEESAPPSPTTAAAAASPETDQSPRDDQPNPATPATTPVAQQPETSTSATSSAPTPSTSITPAAVGSPVPPPKTNMQERLSMLKQRNSAAAKPLPKTPPSTGETPAGASATPAPAPLPSPAPSPSPSLSGQGGEMERRLEEQERWELGKQSERLAAEWRELEAAQALLARRQRDEAEALQRERQAWEESRREAQAQARRAQQQLDEERALLDESKRELARQLELAEQREQGRVQIEQEFVRVQEERRLLEDRKREVREQKMKRRLEEEWKKIEEARRELLELRQAEHARTMEAQAEQVRAEQQRLAAEAEERRQREEAQREEEAREHERLQRIRRQMDDERRKLDRSLRTLGHLEDADDDDAHSGVLEFSDVFARPSPPPATHAAAAAADLVGNGEAKEGETGDAAGDGDAVRAEQHKPSEVEPKAESAPATKDTQEAVEEKQEQQEKEAEEKEAEVKSATEEAAEATTTSVDDGRPHSDKASAPAAAVEEEAAAVEAPKSAAAEEEGGRFVAVREYVAAEEGELGLQPGYEVQHVDGGPDDQWWIGVLIHPASADEASRPMGIFPSAAVVPKGAPPTTTTPVV